MKDRQALSDTHPHLIKEWHPLKNEGLKPEEVSKGSHKKVWWLCKKGKLSVHEWQAQIYSRANGSGCPFCNGKKVCNDNCLANTNPEVAEEWHPVKNGELTPDDVVQGSDKKVWWLCKEGHEWEVQIKERKKYGCPFCSGRYATPINNLKVKNPELAEEWHPTKNNDLCPSDVAPFSGLKVWWKGKCGHEWEAFIRNRANGNGCPYCTSQIVTEETSLGAIFPDLTLEWNFEKNGELTPFDIFPNSNKKVWWVCERGHEWRASVNNRAKGRGCPNCSSGIRTSFPEQSIFYYLAMSTKNVVNRYLLTVQNTVYEIDIYLPELNIGIEYDGYWHMHKKKQDEKKNKVLQKEGIQLIRIREKGLPKINPHGAVIYEIDPSILDQQGEGVRLVFTYLGFNTDNINIKRDRMVIISKYKTYEKENSLSVTHPDLSSQWHPEKNKNLTTDHFLAGSNVKVWWQCDKGHEWQAVIFSRANKNAGCPYCSGRLATIETCLATHKPESIERWHQTRNGKLTPFNNTRYSTKKIWLNCAKGHTFDITPSKYINKPSGYCPICSNERISDEYNLAVMFPEVAKHWHPTKNGDLLPKDFFPKTDQFAWWKGECGHEWDMRISDRVNGDGCPYCSSKRVDPKRSLAKMRPDLTAEWNYEKNNKRPSDFFPQSNKKVWWKCNNNHEWEQSIQRRSSKKKAICPICSSIAFQYPILKLEWHQTKNGFISPEMIKPKSEKFFWWQCKNGHEWQATPRQRTRGSKISPCPECKKMK